MCRRVWVCVCLVHRLRIVCIRTCLELLCAVYVYVHVHVCVHVYYYYYYVHPTCARARVHGHGQGLLVMYQQGCYYSRSSRSI